MIVIGVAMLICTLGCMDAAKSINITYPSNATVGTTFNVTLSLVNFSADIYDVKIDIYNSTNSSQRLSEIYNGTAWRSTTYYVNDIINTSLSNSSVFRLNITSSYNGTANITVRIKDSSESYDTFENYQINITPANSSTSNPPANTTEDDDIIIELDWNEDDIVNGDEFEITVNAENLENEDYDVIVEILNDDDDVISETYGNRDGEDIWKSSKYYAEEVISGSGDDSADIKIRIDSDNSDFSGDATIVGKIRETGSSAIIDEFSGDIEVLEAEASSDDSSDSDSSSSSSSSRTTSSNKTSASSDIITLGISTGSKKAGNNSQNGIIYKSKTEYIKEYAPYAFGILCIFMITLLLLDKTRG
jgi:hypothetical protein